MVTAVTATTKPGANRQPATMTSVDLAEFIAERWLAEAKATAEAPDRATVTAGKLRVLDRALASGDELGLVESAIDPNFPDGRSAWERLTDPAGRVAPMPEATETALLRLRLADPRAVIVTTPNSTSVWLEKFRWPLTVDLSRRASDVLRGRDDARRLRENAGANLKANAAGEAGLTAAVDRARSALVAAGTWSRLVAGDPLAAGWLDGPTFGPWSGTHAGLTWSPAVVRARLVAELAEQARGR